MYCDNQAAVALSKNLVNSLKTRHFRLSWHFIRQVVEAKEVVVEFVRTALQDANSLTKALTSSVHK